MKTHTYCMSQRIIFILSFCIFNGIQLFSAHKHLNNLSICRGDFNMHLNNLSICRGDFNMHLNNLSICWGDFNEFS